MIRKIEKIRYVERGSANFPERHAWVYLEEYSHKRPNYVVSAKELESMAFGC